MRTLLVIILAAMISEALSDTSYVSDSTILFRNYDPRVCACLPINVVMTCGSKWEIRQNGNEYHTLYKFIKTNLKHVDAFKEVYEKNGDGKYVFVEIDTVETIDALRAPPQIMWGD